MLTIAQHCLREAVNNRLTWVSLVLLLFAFLFVEFVGALAITEHRAIQATLFASLLRIGSVVVLVLFVVASLLREQQEGSLEVILSLSMPRVNYVFGKVLAYAVLAGAMAAVCALAMLLYADPVPSVIWGFSLACELLLAGTLGLLLAFTFRQTVAAFAAFAVIYLLARAMGALQLMIAQPVFSAGGWGNAAIETFLQALAWVLPALYRYTNAGWLAEQGPMASDLLYVAGQTLVYLPLLLAAAAADLHRREF